MALVLQLIDNFHGFMDKYGGEYFKSLLNFQGVGCASRRLV